MGGGGERWASYANRSTRRRILSTHHDEVQRVLRLKDLLYLDDVGVVQPADEVDLAAQLSHRFGVLFFVVRRSFPFPFSFSFSWPRAHDEQSGTGKAEAVPGQPADLMIEARTCR